MAETYVYGSELQNGKPLSFPALYPWKTMGTWKPKCFWLSCFLYHSGDCIPCIAMMVSELGIWVSLMIALPLRYSFRFDGYHHGIEFWGANQRENQMNILSYLLGTRKYKKPPERRKRIQRVNINILRLIDLILLLYLAHLEKCSLQE